MTIIKHTYIINIYVNIVITGVPVYLNTRKIISFNFTDSANNFCLSRF